MCAEGDDRYDQERLFLITCLKIRPIVKGTEITGEMLTEESIERTPQRATTRKCKVIRALRRPGYGRGCGNGSSRRCRISFFMISEGRC